MINPENLSPSSQKAIVLTILFVLVAIVLMLLVVPYQMVVAHYDKKMANLLASKSNYTLSIAQGSTALKQHVALERAESLGGFFIASSKPTLASAELQRRVKLTIEQSGGSVVSSQMLGERQQDGVSQVVLRVQLRGTVEQLSKVLYEIESNKPVVLVDNVYIGARPMSSVTQQRSGQSQYLLDARFDVVGFIRPAHYSGS